LKPDSLLIQEQKASLLAALSLKTDDQVVGIVYRDVLFQKKKLIWIRIRIILKNCTWRIFCEINQFLLLKCWMFLSHLFVSHNRRLAGQIQINRYPCHLVQVIRQPKYYNLCWLAFGLYFWRIGFATFGRMTTFPGHLAWKMKWLLGIRLWTAFRIFLIKSKKSVGVIIYVFKWWIIFLIS